MIYEALILDLDGTLVESLPGIASAANQALKKHNYSTYPASTIRTFIGDGSWALCQRALPKSATHEIDALDASFKHYYNTAWQQGTTPFKGIIPLLQECHEAVKNLSSFLISLTILQNKSWLLFFPAIPFELVQGQGQGQGMQKKPDPSITLECIQTIQTAKKHCLECHGLKRIYR